MAAADVRKYVEVRPLRADDHADWNRLWLGYLDFYGAVVEDETRQLTWSRLLDPAEPAMAGLVAIDASPPTPDGSGQALGLAHLIFHRHCWRDGDVCYLQDLFVTPEARGLGAGRALIEAVYAEADRRGAADVYWMTQTSNETARRLYDRIGRATDFMKYTRG